MKLEIYKIKKETKNEYVELEELKQKLLCLKQKTEINFNFYKKRLATINEKLETLKLIFNLKS